MELRRLAAERGDGDGVLEQRRRRSRGGVSDAGAVRAARGSAGRRATAPTSARRPWWWISPARNSRKPSSVSASRRGAGTSSSGSPASISPGRGPRSGAGRRSLDPAEHADRVALVEPRAEQVHVVPDDARHAAGAVGQLDRQERVAVARVAALLALHRERRVDERPLRQVGHVGAPGHRGTSLVGRPGADGHLDSADGADAERYDAACGRCATTPTRVDLADVVVPPYDVIAPADRDALRRRSEYSAVQLVLPESAEPAPAGSSRTGGARASLLRDAEPALWWHVQDYVGAGRREGSRSGFLSAVRLVGLRRGPRAAARADARRRRAGRLELMRARAREPLARLRRSTTTPSGARATRSCRTSPGAPTMEMSDGDGTAHRFWPVTDAGAIAAVQEAMADREIMIADGHHRYETALAYRDERARPRGRPGRRPAVRLRAHAPREPAGRGARRSIPTHRVVMGRREVTDEVLHAVRRQRDRAARRPRWRRRWAWCRPTRSRSRCGGAPAGPRSSCKLRDRAAVGMAMSGAPAPVRKIDAAVLEAVVLAPLLGLLDPGQFATTDSVRYVRELGAATAPVDAGRRVGGVPAARAHRRSGARGRRRRRRHAAEVDLLLPQAALRLPDQSAGRVMRAAWLGVLPPRGRRTSASRSRACPTRDDREPVVGRGEGGDDTTVMDETAEQAAVAQLEELHAGGDRLPARVRGAGRADVRAARALGGRRRPDRRVAEREAAAAVLLPLDRVRRRADDRTTSGSATCATSAAARSGWPSAATGRPWTAGRSAASAPRTALGIVDFEATNAGPGRDRRGPPRRARRPHPRAGRARPGAVPARGRPRRRRGDAQAVAVGRPGGGLADRARGRRRRAAWWTTRRSPLDLDSPHARGRRPRPRRGRRLAELRVRGRPPRSPNCGHGCRAAIREALVAVIDPELRRSVVELDMVRGVDVERRPGRRRRSR